MKTPQEERLIDYKNQKYAVAAFADNFKNSFLNYEEFSTRHSPINYNFIFLKNWF